MRSTHIIYRLISRSSPCPCPKISLVDGGGTLVRLAKIASGWLSSVDCVLFWEGIIVSKDKRSLKFSRTQKPFRKLLHSKVEIGCGQPYVWRSYYRVMIKKNVLYGAISNNYCAVFLFYSEGMFLDLDGQGNRMHLYVNESRFVTKYLRYNLYVSLNFA